MLDAKTVPPSQIESALNNLWESLERTGKMRASLFNLVLYAKKDAREEYIRTLTKTIIEKFPSRVIFVLVDPDKDPNYSETKISIMAGSEQRKDYACDYIEIGVGTSALERVPFLILPQLISDLPVYLVLAQDICQPDPIVAALEKMANRLILDSEMTKNLPCFARSALEHRSESKCDLADLNWARMESWRDLLSSTFYSQDHFDELKAAHTIAISYNSTPSPYFCHPEIQALYLQGWLAAQLGWSFGSCERKNGTLSLYYSKENSPLVITLTPSEHPNLSPGSITDLQLHTDNKVIFVFTRDLKYPHQITLDITTPEQCYLPTQFVFAKGEAGGSLVKEVSHKGTSEHYLNTLKLISQLSEL